MAENVSSPLESTTRISDQRAPSKKPYVAPALCEYGSVSKLTAAKSGDPTDNGRPRPCL